MSESQKKVGLIAYEIEFTYFTIVYKVMFETGHKLLKNRMTGIVVCSEDIKNKDLNIKPTILNGKYMQVIFHTLYTTPHFYQSLLNKTRKDYNEYKNELKNIYKVGDIVGFMLL